MELAKAPINGSPWQLADWVEFQVLSSDFKLFRFEDLIRIADEEQEVENSAISDQDARNERLLEIVVEEIQNRIDCLKEAYPFQFESYDALTLKNGLTDGAQIYFYCLLFSHTIQNDVLLSTPPTEPNDRDLMQVCSTLAAAGIVQGSSVSFGFPRIDSSGFLDALKSTYEAMGEGEVVEVVPVGAPAMEKDGRVDVIAWSSTPDGCAGKNYMLGQVASGANWKDKSIRGEIDLFHHTWFTHTPVSTARPAMFIPFCIDVGAGETLNDVIDFYTRKFGDVYYRYRLPYYANKGCELAEDSSNGLRIDRYDEISKIKDYVNDFLSCGV